MMVVTGREFRANQSKFIGAAYRGEEVVVKARAGSFRIVPSNGDHEFSYFGMNNGKRISKSHEVFTPKAVLGTMRMLSKEKLT